MTMRKSEDGHKDGRRRSCSTQRVGRLTSKTGMILGTEEDCNGTNDIEGMYGDGVEAEHVLSSKRRAWRDSPSRKPIERSSRGLSYSRLFSRCIATPPRFQSVNNRSSRWSLVVVRSRVFAGVVVERPGVPHPWVRARPGRLCPRPIRTRWQPVECHDPRGRRAMEPKSHEKRAGPGVEHGHGARMKKRGRFARLICSENGHGNRQNKP